MPWIKLYQDILDDRKMFELGAYQIGVWCQLMLICARVGNELSTNQRYLKSKLNLKKPVNLDLFESLGLIEFFERVEDAPGARLEERRGEERTSPSPLTGESTDFEEITQAWNRIEGPKILKVRGLYPKRMDLWSDALKRHPKNYWFEIFEKVSKSKFLMEIKKTKTSIEWALDHHVEILEGKYDDDESSQKWIRNF